MNATTDANPSRLSARMLGAFLVTVSLCACQESAPLTDDSEPGSQDAGFDVLDAQEDTEPPGPDTQPSPDASEQDSGEGVERPWFDLHIKPIMESWCTGCHGPQPAGGAPDSFRLDECDPEDKGGAQLMAARILARAVEGQSSFMPPGPAALVSEIDAETLENWVAIGAPCTEEEAREGGDPTPRHHPEGWSNPALHGRAAKLQEDDCRTCHGEDLKGASALSCDTCHTQGWRTACTRCHGGELDNTGAPPRDLDPDQPAIFDVHTAHVVGTIHAPFDCTHCHTKPIDVLSTDHMFDDTPAMAEVTFAQGLSPSGQYDGQGACSNLYCHGTGRRSGAWSVSRDEVGCTSCHANQRSGRDGWETMSPPHEDHLREGLACHQCHGEVVDIAGNIREVGLHVNGQPDIMLQQGMTRQNGACTGTCHGERHNGRLWVDD